ncbi:hypothetical protein [Methylobacterium sp. WL120]|uniref:hypothetical protein n=1 Tax=Methylobacterium sp. WL120 TaxID=2603887 RepID=UPI0011D46E57|nr:hypothetical protein [Methylobacterium sp. WL120]TXM65450.1 hypothetical protein FV229_15495 [Methylobacterium sp. WL120]
MPRSLNAKSGRGPNDQFAKFVSSLPRADKILGLTHITSSYALRDVVNSGKIQALEPCKVLGEDVIYAFYGRAAFRSSHDIIPTALSSLFPSVLILDPASIPPPKYVFGFDSGAFMNGALDQYLHPYMPLFDFLLAPDLISVAKLIKAVFLNNEDFFNNIPSPSFTVPAANFEAESYKSIISSGGQGNVRLDDRISTPEIIFSDPIDLRRSVRAAVLPDSIAAEPTIGGVLRSYGITVVD